MPWIFSMTKKEKERNAHPMFFGVELELALPMECMDSLELPDTVYTDNDGSIRINDDEEDLELQFHPGTFNWWKSYRKTITKLLKALVVGGGESGTERRCGLHIHFDNTLSEEHLVNFCQFIYGNPQYMQKLSRRTESHSHQYASLQVVAPEYNHTRQYVGCTCSMCLEGAFRRGAQGVTRNTNKVLVVDHIRATKSAAVSIWENTVELRLFAGTLDVNEFYAGLQFTRAVINYTKPTDYDHSKLGNIPAFKSWLSTTKRQKQYQDLLSIMSNKQLTPLEPRDANPRITV